jgi:hypothetical protein
MVYELPAFAPVIIPVLVFIVAPLGVTKLKTPPVVPVIVTVFVELTQKLPE